MSTPESSNSKVPPSLLSDKAKGADANDSRILANLEGRVAPSTDKPRASKMPVVLVALLVIAAGGWGAWHMQQRVHSESVAAATDGGEKVTTGATVAAAAASAASGAPAVAAKAEAPAPASSQAATIVADDSDSRSTAASAATPASGDAERLSRALAQGTDGDNASASVANATSSAQAPVAASVQHGKKSAVLASKEKHEATRAAAHDSRHEKPAKSRTELASAHHTESKSVAQSKKAHASAQKDDSDADLLAALVARTKPADPKAADPKAAAGTATRVSAATGNAKLAERVKACSQKGFFEDQLCRWRVCDGQWGKDPACPASAQQARQP